MDVSDAHRVFLQDRSQYCVFCRLYYIFARKSRQFGSLKCKMPKVRAKAHDSVAKLAIFAKVRA